jgi:hypothetical protein
MKQTRTPRTRDLKGRYSTEASENPQLSSPRNLISDLLAHSPRKSGGRFPEHIGLPASLSSGAGSGSPLIEEMDHESENHADKNSEEAVSKRNAVLLASSGRSFIDLIDEIRGPNRITTEDIVKETINCWDLKSSDSPLLKNFGDSDGTPSSLETLISAMDKKFIWFKLQRQEFQTKIRKQKGKALQDSIDRFMKDLACSSKSSALTTLMITVHECSRQKTESEKPEEQVLFYLSQRARIWTEKIMFSSDENWAEDLCLLSEGIEPEIEESEMVRFHECPGRSRISDMVNFPTLEHVGSLAAVALSFIHFMAPDSHVSALDPLKLRDNYLIMERDDHSGHMKKSRHTVERYEKVLPCLCCSKAIKEIRVYSIVGMCLRLRSDPAPKVQRFALLTQSQ